MKHLIVISVDAMVYEDLEYLRGKPGFARLLDGGSVIERVRTIYPSLTHPVHASILTGAPAGVTGIVSNHIFNRERPDEVGGPWYNRLCEMRCDTLLHAAKRGGLTTAVSTWPMTVSAGEVIDYLVPNAMNYYFDGREGDLSVYRELGAGEEVMGFITEAARRYGTADIHPYSDYFQVYCATEIIKKYKPNLLLIHPSDVDNKRHRSGVFGSEVTGALDRADAWLSDIFAAVDEAGITDETDIVVLSDHGQINTARLICPNVWLVDAGLITLDADGHVKAYDAFCQSCGASAHVYLSDPTDKALYERVLSLLRSMADEGIYGFERVYTTEQTMEMYGLSGEFSFVLETDGYTAFSEHLTRPAVRPHDITDYRFGRATHGHEPHKGPQPTFIAKGPSFKRGVVIPEGNILNHAPTLARAVGVELYDAVGVAVEEILSPDV